MSTFTNFTRTAAQAGMGLLFAMLAANCPARDFVATQPAPRVEYWQKRQAIIEQELRDPTRMAAVKLLFVGDSITDYWLLHDDPWVPGQLFGLQVWNDNFGPMATLNRGLNIGISGDRIEHVLHRISPKSAGGLGQMDAPGLKPEFIVLLIGINNSWAAESPVVDSIAAGTRAVLRLAHQRQPRARIILQSLLPTREPARNIGVVRPVNIELAAMAASPEFAPFTSYLDLHAGFVDAQGVQIARYFDDGLHPNQAGYRAWRDLLLPFLARERAKSAPSVPGK